MEIVENCCDISWRGVLFVDQCLVANAVKVFGFVYEFGIGLCVLC